MLLAMLFLLESESTGPMTMLALSTFTGRLPAVWEGPLPGEGVANISALGKYAGTLDIDGRGSLKVIGRVAVIDWEDIVGLAEISLLAQGLKSQNFDRQAGNTGVVTVSGTAYYMSVPLRAGQVVNSVVVAVTTAGAAVTTGQVAVYNSAGVRLAISANITTAWQSVGIKTHVLGSSVIAPETDIYYVAILAIASTTQPSMLRTVTGTTIPAGAAPGGVQPYGTQTGLATLPANFALGMSGAIPFWVGLS